MTDYQYRAAEYLDLCHAMQTGVAFTMGSSTEPKHLRVGINVNMTEHAALVKTLVDAGLIEFEKYRDNQIEMMQQEIALYTRIISEQMGGNEVDLH